VVWAARLHTCVVLLHVLACSFQLCCQPSLWSTCCCALLQVLSANSESPLNCECLMEDTDVHSQLNR